MMTLPAPGWSSTFAMDVLRRPTALNWLRPALRSLTMSPPFSAACWRQPDPACGWLGAGVDVQVPKLLRAERRVRDHASHRPLDHPLWPLLQLHLDRPRLEAARIPRVAIILLLVQLGARQRDLLRVEHDDMIAGVQVGRKGRLVLAPQ